MNPFALKFFRGFLFSALLLNPLFLPFSPKALAQGDIRKIKIIGAVSSEFKKNPLWQQEIRERIAFANQIFLKQFGLDFFLGQFEDWEPEDEKRESALLIEELRAKFAIGADEILIGFHHMSQPYGQNTLEDADTVGTAEFFRGIVVLRDPFQEMSAMQKGTVLTHELAHLFGAVHISDENQVMNAVLPAEPMAALDPDNQEIIAITRRADFQQGLRSLPPEAIDSLIRLYEKLIRKNPHSDFYYQLGNFYEIQGQKARAVSVWEEAVRYQYDNPMIHWQLGLYYYDNSRFEAAIQEIGSAVAHFILPSQKEERAQAFNLLGVAYYEKGNLEEAIVTWLKGLSSDPDNPELQGNLAAAYLRRGDVDRGITELEKLVVKYPEDTTSLSNLGVAYIRKREFEKAAQSFQAALQKMKVVPREDQRKNILMQGASEATLRGNLGAAYLDMRRYDEALEQLLAARDLEPANADNLRNLCQAYTLKGEYDKAIVEIQAALQLKRDDPVLYALLAQAYAETGKKQNAIQSAREGIRYAEAPLKASLYKNIAILYAQDQDYPAALTDLKNSLNFNWNDADTHTKLAMIQGQSGNAADAKRSLQTALRIDPHWKEAKQVLESLQTAKE